MQATIDRPAVGDKVSTATGGKATITSIQGDVITTGTGLDWNWDNDREWLVSIASDNGQETAAKPVYDYRRLGEQLHRWGANVTAIRPNSKQPITSWKDLQERSQTEAELAALPWAMAGGVGIVNGSGSFRCIDIDAKKGRTVSVEYKNAWLAALGLPLDYPWCYRSGSGRGWHIWTKGPAGDIDGVLTVKPIKAPEVDHIEFRWTTGQTVISVDSVPSEPPAEVSFSTVKNALEALTLPKDSDDPKQEESIPERQKGGANGQSVTILQTQTEYAKVALERAAQVVRAAPEGSRNNTLRDQAPGIYELINGGDLDRFTAEQTLTTAALAAGLEEKEIAATLKSARDYVGNRARTAPEVDPARRWPAPLAEKRNLTDTGNSERFIDQHGAGLRYVPAWDQWLVWTGRQWRRDDRNQVNYLARKTVRAIYAGAAAEDDEKERKRLASHALRSESRGKQRAMIDLAKDDPRVTIDHAQLDSDPWLLNVMNGTLDLRTAELLPHDPDNLITKLISVPYDPGATAPYWLAFLERVMGGNVDLETYLQRAFGYSLTGVTWEQCLFFLWGSGRNGKSTLTDVLHSLFGDYGARTQTETLLVKNYGGGASNDLARLPGARFVLASEVEEGRRMAESLVKDITGSDWIAARFLYGEFFEFLPQFKLWLYGNHKPSIRGTDDGIWRRLRLIPFNVQIPESEVDRRLAEKLRAELPGILAWAVNGCLDWQRRGDLGEPAEVIDATAEYRTEQDILAEFLDICSERAIGSEVKAQDMHSAYAGWAEENGEKTNSARWLGFRLRDRGYAVIRQSQGNYWQNVTLTEEGERLRDAYQGKKGIM